uniref:Uncharacterized protein n=1 Tax=Romanomermis culicivorax TaxID=13658 RepID=A0A915J5M6_ROMCU
RFCLPKLRLRSFPNELSVLVDQTNQIDASALCCKMLQFLTMSTVFGHYWQLFRGFTVNLEIVENTIMDVRLGIV